MSEVRALRIVGRGAHGRVELDGVELQDGLLGLTLSLGHGQLPTLVLDPAVVAADVDIDGPVEVSVPHAARQMLVALGWTPPVTGPGRS
ncbi:MAG: hypothetical protein L0H64_17600 [Pseudonocardia sp.]|nr:hypothetical protein [Pseudonocardia sp.]